VYHVNCIYRENVIEHVVEFVIRVYFFVDEKINKKMHFSCMLFMRNIYFFVYEKDKSLSSMTVEFNKFSFTEKDVSKFVIVHNRFI
jgi:hypothetical protein